MSVFQHFSILGDFVRAERLNTGHINETYTATYNQGGKSVRYIHQKLNRNVFKNPAAVMKNLVRVTSHIRQKLEAAGVPDVSRRVLTVVPTRDGRSYFQSADGDVWRTFVRVEGAQTRDAVQTPAQAYQAGKAFGEFQSLLVDLPGGRLTETIPHFHDTRKRFGNFAKAARADRHNRAAGARKEIEFAQSRQPITGVIVDAMKSGEIPERITHNDTKFNNVMLDNASGKALCVVDLDTVMPGCSLYDFGDMVRSATSSAREDERDLSQVRMQLPTFKALAKGYLATAGQFLGKRERELLAFSARLITFELGLRFLTDYLDGDKYFRTQRRGQNLDRCRAQFKLVESIERQEEKMEKMLKS
jgi:Ser/Thr protein kinase RdoA (MazF antagonist)